MPARSDLWQARRPWPQAAGPALVLGQVSPGMTVTHPYVGSPSGTIEIDVVSDQQTWIGVFDLATVDSRLNGGIDYENPITEAELNRIGGCPAPKS